ncbi:MAG TPA: hypothetical protein VI258_09760, partial [Rhodanobacteraceae bacterium]
MVVGIAKRRPVRSRFRNAQLARLLRPVRVSVMSPRLSVERNVVAAIGKSMAFRHIAAEDEHRDVDTGAGDGDFFCVDAIDGCGNGRGR